MAMIVLGTLALLAIVVLGKLFAGADPRLLAKLLRWVGAIVMGLAALGLLALDRVGVGMLLASMAYGLFTGGHVLPQGWRRTGGQGSSQAPPPRRGRSGMTREEAYAVLGLKPGAGKEEIRAAHKKLMLQNHPDRGGTDYLASKINEAKDVLLG